MVLLDFSYDIISEIENIPKAKNRDTSFPDCNFMLSDSLIIFDNVERTVKIVVNIKIRKNSNIDKLYNNGLKKIKDIEKKLRSNTTFTSKK